MITDKLIDRIIELDNPTVAGLDPRLDYVPEFIRKECFEAYGETKKAVAECFYRFNVGLIDTLADVVPAVKPQVAMYEQYGAEGMDAYIRTIAYAKGKGLIVIGDIKRSDIASTAEAYADGHIGRVTIGGKAEEVYKEDFITLNPYLGSDSIEPYLGSCEAYDRGLFILVKTSNPRSGEIQDLDVGGRPLYEAVSDLVESWGKKLRGAHGFSAVGAVVGATHPAQAARIREIMPHTFFLVPGYGAQGGGAADVAPCFNKDGLGAIVNSSRGIIAAYQAKAYKERFSEKEYALAARQAALDMKADLRTIR